MPEHMNEADWRRYVIRKFQDGEARFDTQDKALDSIKKDLRELLDVFQAGKIGGAIFKWAAAIGAASAVIYATFKGIK